jgi:hypothetical protein
MKVSVLGLSRMFIHERGFDIQISLKMPNKGGIGYRTKTARSKVLIDFSLF